MNNAVLDLSNPFAASMRAKNESVGITESIWEDEELPVPFDRFVTSPEQLAFVPLSDRQYEACFALLYGVSYKKYKQGKVKLNLNIFENDTFTLAVLLWGKGSGKDQISALIIIYICYILLKMRDPQLMLGSAPGEAIDVVNVARSAAQASTVFFTKLRQRILSWKWLRTKYSVRLSGKPLATDSKTGVTEDNAVFINTNGVSFPKSIRLLSKNSQEESFEGLNLIAWIMDESSSFKDTTRTANAEKIYNVLNSSANTRFGSKARGLILSYPRHAEDFTMKFYALSQKEIYIYGDKAATWEVKPRHFFSKQTFKFEGIDIPMDFKKDFDRNPQDAATKYLCMPPDAESPFVIYPERVDLCIVKTPPILEMREWYSDGKAGKEITKWKGGHNADNHIITIDLSLSDCETGFCISHKERDKLIIDFITSIIPKKGFVIDLDNVQKLVEAICEKINVMRIAADRWQSALLLQKLKSKGLNAEPYSLSYPDYKRFLDLIYSKKIELPNDEKLIKQIKSLELSNGNKVDRTSGTYKDMCLEGHTKISLLNGTEIEIKDLVGKEVEVYSCLPDGTLKVGKATNVRPTGVREDMLRVWLDNKKYVDCTSDHPFMLRNGSYAKAKDLRVGESLMPLYKKFSVTDPRHGLNNYEMILDNKSNSWLFTHRVVVRDAFHFFYGRAKKDRKVVHHKDFNRRNNSSANLQILGWDEHRKLHAVLGKTNFKALWKDPVWAAKQRKRLKIQNGTEAHREQSRKNITSYNKSPERVAKLTANGQFSRNGIKSMNKFWANPETRAKKILSVTGANNPNYRHDLTIEQLQEAFSSCKSSWGVLKLLHCSMSSINHVLHANNTNWTEFFKDAPAKRGIRPLRRKDITLDKILEATANNTNKRQMLLSLGCTISPVSRILRDNNIVSHELFQHFTHKRLQGIINHTVVKVEGLPPGEVFDLTVPIYSNFALEAGVFVHNCDTVVGACKILFSGPASETDSAEGEYISSNLAGMGGTFIGSH